MRFSTASAALLFILCSGCDSTLEKAAEGNSGNSQSTPQSSNVRMFDGSWVSAFGIMSGAPDERFVFNVAYDGNASLSLQRRDNGSIMIVSTSQAKVVESGGKLAGELINPPVIFSSFSQFSVAEGDGVGTILMSSPTGYSMTMSRQN